MLLVSGKNVPVDVPIVGDAKNVLTELNKQVGTTDIDPWARSDSGMETEISV